jgi:hypothetical protein
VTPLVKTALSIENMAEPGGPLVSTLVEGHMQHVILYLAVGIQLCAAILIGLAAAQATL